MRLRIEATAGPLHAAAIRALPYAISCGLHGLIIGMALHMPGDFRSPLEAARAKSMLSRELERAPVKVIWLPRRAELPTVSPGTRERLILPFAADRQPHTIITTKKAKRDQFIWVEEPKVAQQQPLPSENLIAVGPRLDFEPPPPKKELRKFNAPAEKRPDKKEDAINDLQEEILRAKAVPDATAPSYLASAKAKAPLRQFNAPAEPKRGNGRGIELAAPEEATQGLAAITGTRVNLAILSTNPASTGPPEEPQGNRAGAISIGGQPNGQGRGQAGGVGGAVVPGLAVRSGEASPSGTAPPVAAPKPGPVGSVVSTLPPAANTVSIALALWPNARRVPAPVEAMFRDRPVFTTLMQSPNGTPDWVIWFSDLVAVPYGTRIFMRPPVPRVVFWQIPNEAAARLPEFVWVSGRLRRDGKLAVTGTTPPIPPPAAAPLFDALSGWLFTPAVRNGEAVDVEVLIGIAPFKRR